MEMRVYCCAQEIVEHSDFIQCSLAFQALSDPANFPESGIQNPEFGIGPAWFHPIT